METRDTEGAFKWIVRILKDNNIPFQIEGGFAARLYGADRELADIDISIPEDTFDKVMPHIKEFIVYGPEQYKDDEWDLKLITLTYKGQDIDLAGAYEKKNFDKINNKWVNTPYDLSDSVYMDVYGVNVPVIRKENLIAYKKLIQRDVDIFDIKAMGE